jgi:hypothetical protein
MWQLIMAAALAAPWQIPVQGAVTGVDGAPAQGVQNVTFAFHTAATGQPVWSTTGPVAFVDGTFAAWISHDGSVIPNFGAQPAWWLSITLQDGVPSTPAPIGAAPLANYAAQAGDADTVDGHDWSEVPTTAIAAVETGNRSFGGSVSATALTARSGGAISTTGAISGGTGAFSGALSAGAGTFAALSATTGTFSGALAAAGIQATGGASISTSGAVNGGTGAFSGTVSAAGFQSTGGAGISTTGAVNGGTGVFSGALTAASLQTSGGGSITTTGAVNGATGVYSGALSAGSLQASGGGSITTSGAVNGGTGVYSGSVTAGSLQTTGGGAITTSGAVNGGSGLFTGGVTATGLTASGGGTIATTGAVNAGSINVTNGVNAASYSVGGTQVIDASGRVTTAALGGRSIPRVFRAQHVWSNKACGAALPTFTFTGTAGEQATIWFNWQGRPDANGHTYYNMQLNGSTVMVGGEWANSSWRRNMTGMVNVTLTSNGTQTVSGQLECGNGTSVYGDTVGEYPLGGLTYTVIVGG